MTTQTTDSQSGVVGEWLVIQEKNPQALRGAFHFQNGKLEKKSLEKASRVFDLASLTKVILTSTLLVDQLEKNYESDWSRFLDLNLRDELPEFALIPDWIDLRIRSLWEHRSSLMPHFYLSGSEDRRLRFEGPRSAMWKRIAGRICEEHHALQAQRSETRYSDLGFWPLGYFLENREGLDLEKIWSKWKKLQPQISPEELLFSTEIKDFSSVVPTETRHAVGEVNDDNAYWMHSVAPHAGLFGSADGVYSWFQVIQKWIGKNPALKFWITRQDSSQSRFWLGWDTASGEMDSPAGSHFAGPKVIGHLGWTGTSLWWDPAGRAFGVLLSNRTYPQHSESSQMWMRKLRCEFFSDLWQSKIAENWLP